MNQTDGIQRAGETSYFRLESNMKIPKTKIMHSKSASEGDITAIL
jgi:hypothetical protein